MLPRTLLPAIALAALSTGLVLATQQQTPPQQTPPAQQPAEIELRIRGDAGAAPRYAVPDFIALSPDAETAAIARTIGQVLWDDLQFERDYYMIPRDTYGSIPPARSITDIPFDRWRELGADALVVGTVEKTAAGVRVEMRLFQVRDRRSAMGREYTGSAGNPRLFAHTMADEIFDKQSGLRGVARTKLTFSSDRDGERVTGTVQSRDVKEIYIADYDGANQRRVTVNRNLNAFPSWSPDGRAISYTSWRRGFPDIFVSLIYEGRLLTPAEGNVNKQNYLGVFSPDGSRIAFISSRDGNPELYVMNRDGSNVRRITRHQSSDVTPTWAPSGNVLAFVSDRTGSPQIYTINADGTDLKQLTRESHCDRPTWSPSPFNEIAYTSQTGRDHDIKVIDLTTGQVKQLTFGHGSSESPAFSPNGRHIAFMSNRTGKYQVYTMARDGKDVRQVTRAGGNFTPNWSQ